MPRVNGLLSVVTEAPETVTEVIVRAPEPRAAGSGLVTVSPVVVRVEDGVFDAVLAPGPCVLTLLSAGVPVGQVHLLVPEGPVSLRTAFEAALAADTGTRDVLERLAVEAAAAVEAAGRSAESAAGSAAEAAGSAGVARDGAGRAVSAAEAAAGHEERAGEAAERAGVAEAAAASSAAGAADAAERAGVARDGAAESATRAESSAKRAEGVAGSTRWDGDRLTVNEQTSPPLTGPRGPKGEPGMDGNDGVDGRDGRADGLAVQGDETPPTATGRLALAAGWAAKATGDWSSAVGRGATSPGDYSGAFGYKAEAQGWSASAVGRNAKAAHLGSTAIGYNASTSANYQVSIGRHAPGYSVELAGDVRLTLEPVDDDNATTKKYVDSAVMEAKAHADTRPAFFSGAGAPPASIPGARVGDYYLDETTMELHKITGV